MSQYFKALRPSPPIFENPEKKLKEINLRIAQSAEAGRYDNESVAEFNKRTAGYFTIKRECIAQLRNEGGCDV